MIAVLTADLIDSSLYDEKFLAQVLNNINREFKTLDETYPVDQVQFNIFRGDSLQGIIKPVGKALLIALQLKAAINKVPQKNKNSSIKQADIKLAVGIGSFDFIRESISESNGQAFQYSGRTLDEMKNENRKIRLKTSNDNINDEFNASLFLLDIITDRWTTASAEVVYYLLQGMKEREIAAKLGISQSAVNQRKKTAGWEAISVLLDRFQNTISKNFIHG